MSCNLGWTFPNGCPKLFATEKLVCNPLGGLPTPTLGTIASDKQHLPCPRTGLPAASSPRAGDSLLGTFLYYCSWNRVFLSHVCSLHTSLATSHLSTPTSLFASLLGYEPLQDLGLQGGSKAQTHPPPHNWSQTALVPVCDTNILAYSQRHREGLCMRKQS